jgi:hypothetical protein
LKLCRTDSGVKVSYLLMNKLTIKFVKWLIFAVVSFPLLFQVVPMLISSKSNEGFALGFAVILAYVVLAFNFVLNKITKEGVKNESN